MPLEIYGVFDPNLSDPHVRISCPEGAPVVPSPGGNRHASCPDRAIPLGTLDVAAALASGDDHARAHCRSVGYLIDHLDASVQSAIRARHPCTAEPREP